jgi:putative ABC transport system permease protein
MAQHDDGCRPMRTPDLIRFARDAATGNPLRTLLLVLAMAIGVAAVVVLTALGDGARRYVLNQFSSIGSNLVIVLPGRSQTGGFNPGNAITSTPRDLTIDDAQALRRASAVHRVAPLAVGTSEISVGGKLREVMVAGTTADFIEVRRLTLAQGRFLPLGDWRRGAIRSGDRRQGTRAKCSAASRRSANWCASATAVSASSASSPRPARGWE